MIVLDGSAALELLLRSPKGQAVRTRLVAAGLDIHAPHLIDVELISALRRVTRAGNISAQRARAALSDWPLMPVTRYDHLPLVDSIWTLRFNFTAYDAAYIALAAALDVPLITCDAKMLGAPGHAAQVELI